jgi:hypothetical protein
MAVSEPMATRSAGTPQRMSISGPEPSCLEEPPQRCPEMEIGRAQMSDLVRTGFFRLDNMLAGGYRCPCAAQLSW